MPCATIQGLAGGPVHRPVADVHHRAVNGAPAAAFLDALCERIETLAPCAFGEELGVASP
nr:hypothetical protein [Halomonas saliphila]